MKAKQVRKGFYRYWRGGTVRVHTCTSTLISAESIDGKVFEERGRWSHWGWYQGQTTTLGFFDQLVTSRRFQRLTGIEAVCAWIKWMLIWRPE